MNFQKRKFNKTGFTLVEVMIAVAILSLSILAYVGLLQSGLSHMNIALNRSTESRITQNMLREVQQTEWGNLDETYKSIDVRTRHFDDQGLEVKLGDVTQVYTARLYLDESDNEVHLPGDDTANVQRNPHLRNAIIRITNRPGQAGRSLLNDDSNHPYFREYSGTIINLGKRQPDSNSAK